MEMLNCSMFPRTRHDVLQPVTRFALDFSEHHVTTFNQSTMHLGCWSCDKVRLLTLLDGCLAGQEISSWIFCRFVHSTSMCPVQVCKAKCLWRRTNWAWYVRFSTRLWLCVVVWQYSYAKENADWSKEMRGQSLLNAIPLQGWIIMSTQRDQGNATDLFSTLQKVCSGMGMPIDKPQL